jgi:REP element-mobilizing transposase RayT
MPAKNCIKIPVENGYYHIYNRGVNKQEIYTTPQDYSVFLNYLKEALSPPLQPDELPTFRVNLHGTTFIKPRRQPKNFCGEIDLIAYVLMPNHFHFLIKQNKRESMEAFMRSIATRYSMYVNKAYGRVGTLFQGIYKAVLIENEQYLLHLSRYIHLNPSAYSSYANYIGMKKTQWVHPCHVLDFFGQPTNPEFKKFTSYKDFVEKYKTDKSNQESFLVNLTLED